MESSLAKKCLAVLLSVLLAGMCFPAVSSAAPVYTLINSVKAEIKSVVNERIAEGSRIAAVVRLRNLGTTAVRVPEYEVRAVTGDKLAYTLQPGDNNPKSIQPKETVELGYMTVVRRNDNFAVSKLVWIKSNVYVYPKKEQQVLAIPVASSKIAVQAWGQSFVIPTASAALFYTPIQLTRQSLPQGPAAVIALQVDNRGESAETVPEFRIDGKTDFKTYTGKPVGTGKVVLAPGEKQRIYFAVPSPGDAKLRSLIVNTPESFTGPRQQTVTYGVDRLEIPLPEEIGGGVSAMAGLPPAPFGTRIKMDPFNKLFDPDIEVSLADLRMFKTEGDAFQTAVAKFKLVNRGTAAVPIPVFDAQLVSEGGRYYQGTRLAGEAGTLAPNLGYVVQYSFQVPGTEPGGAFGMMLLDGRTFAPYAVPVASFRTDVRGDADSQASVYPFQVRLNSWTAVSNQVKINADVSREDDIVVDKSFSKIKIVLTNASGQTVGTQTLPLIGADRLASGMRVLAPVGASAATPAGTTAGTIAGTTANPPAGTQANGFAGTDALPATVQMYEVIDTPYGEVQRLLKKMP